MKTKIVLYILLFHCSVLLKAQDIFDAARKGNIARMEQLIKINPDTINTRNGGDFTPLILAGYYGQTEAVEFLLKHKVDINANSPEGPVILGACYKGNVELVELLIKYKVNVNSQNDIGTTGLMFAALNNSPELVKLLLKNGADKSIKEKSGKTAFSYAQMYESKEIIMLLTQ